MTPNLAIVRIETPHWRCIPLCIPLSLLWIPVILFSPLIVIVVFGLAIAGRTSPWHAFKVIWDIVSSLPGTHVRVSTDDAKVIVRIL